MNWPPAASGVLVMLLVIAGGLIAYGFSKDAVASVAESFDSDTKVTDGDGPKFFGGVIVVIVIVLFALGKRG